jgi:hypothetical protein
MMRRDRFERQMRDELQFHVSAYAAGLQRSGLSREEPVRRGRGVRQL